MRDSHPRLPTLPTTPMAPLLLCRVSAGAITTCSITGAESVGGDGALSSLRFIGMLYEGSTEAWKQLAAVFKAAVPACEFYVAEAQTSSQKNLTSGARAMFRVTRPQPVRRVWGSVGRVGW